MTYYYIQSHWTSWAIRPNIQIHKSRQPYERSLGSWLKAAMAIFALFLPRSFMIFFWGSSPWPLLLLLFKRIEGDEIRFISTRDHYSARRASYGREMKSRLSSCQRPLEQRAGGSEWVRTPMMKKKKKRLLPLQQRQSITAQYDAGSKPSPVRHILHRQTDRQIIHTYTHSSAVANG